MDQTAMPVMLGWQLRQHGLLSDADVEQSYWADLKPAAEFYKGKKLPPEPLTEDARA